jgi:O-antigen ligase
VLFACLLAFDAAISDGSVSRSVVNRLVLDDEENLGSLGSRTSIWRFAGQEFFEGTTWLTGVGTGGVDKALGKFYEFTGRVAGRDRIWRLYPHNSLVQNALAYGIFGLLLAFCLAAQVGRKAYLLDSRFGGWQRTAFAVFLGLVGTGGVVEREVYWIALGSALWAMISSDNLPSQARAAASRVWRTQAGQMRASQSSHASPGFN